MERRPKKTEKRLTKTEKKMEVAKSGKEFGKTTELHCWGCLSGLGRRRGKRKEEKKQEKKWWSERRERGQRPVPPSFSPTLSSCFVTEKNRREGGEDVEGEVQAGEGNVEEIGFEREEKKQRRVSLANICTAFIKLQHAAAIRPLELKVNQILKSTSLVPKIFG